ncbi:MAG: hypothetical protein ACT4PV_02960 [Planctomycetaceae bacterium]
MGKLLLGALLLAAACASTGMHSRDAPPPPGSGRALYEQSCQRCHALYMPRSFSAHEWDFYVRKYGRRARLDAEGQRLVLGYLSAHARGSGGARQGAGPHHEEGGEELHGDDRGDDHGDARPEARVLEGGGA